MRVIAGKARGHKLATTEGLETRPTKDRIKENLFNIISNDVISSNFLDLFAGSGAIGIEALSRGARLATFVENNKAAVQIIRENLTHTKFLEQSKIINSDAWRAVESFYDKGEKFDVIFLDPPYSSGFENKFFDLINEKNILNEDGIIIIEHSSKDDEYLSGIFEKYKFKDYNKTCISFYRKKLYHN